jgi:indolepyruvate decarboxylase
LASRLSQIGLKHHFAVAGDYSLVLLDELLKNKDLKQVYCSNELNCGFSAEGYARARGAGAAVVTFSVGALSALNAVGGAHAENLPVILVSGAPNTNDRATEHLLHHTLGTHDFLYQLEIATKLTCAAVSITSAEDAPGQIDHAIRTALRERKPAYIEIACNIAAAPCAAPGPVSAVVNEEPSDPESLKAAVAAAAQFLRGKRKPTLLIGSKLRAAGAEKEAVELADALGCAVAVMAAAKGFFPEDHPQFVGVYWGEVRAPGARGRRLVGRPGLHRHALQRLLGGRLDRDAERPRRADGGPEPRPPGGARLQPGPPARLPSGPRPCGREARRNDGRVRTHPPRASA